MSDIIQILPDSVANQIAAGEVVQRPASAVKELLENAVDAKSGFIQLIVKDAGKTLIQVIDDGIGMSETDARLCFERHATSKLRRADDLFAISTKGFRGEALASIAAIASVELKTKQAGKEVGTCIVNEGCDVKSQEPVASANGTSISVKNLFFNVPARRNFLKSNTVEFNHITDEFIRVALAHPEIGFSLHHNGHQIYHVAKGNLKQRIAALFGTSYIEKLSELETETSIVKLSGFIARPDHARKTRGEQFLFVNNRFIKSSYLHHAVMAGYTNLLQTDSFPNYFIFMEVNPSTIDVNIHPTKTEVKFENDREIYTILMSAVRMSIGKHHLTPKIDFETESGIELPLLNRNREVVEPKINVNPDFNPFDTDAKKAGNGSLMPSFKPANLNQHNNLKQWESLYEIAKNASEERQAETFVRQTSLVNEEEEDVPLEKGIFQLQGRYIVTTLKSGLLVIHQHLAHERVLYEEFLAKLQSGNVPSQQLLFPTVIDLNEKDIAIIKEMEEDLNHLGFNLSYMGNQSIALNGIPALISENEATTVLEQLLHAATENYSEIKLNKTEQLARYMAKYAAIKAGKTLSREEMLDLKEKLFSCQLPNKSAFGRNTMYTIPTNDIEKEFK